MATHESIKKEIADWYGSDGAKQLVVTSEELEAYLGYRMDIRFVNPPIQGFHLAPGESADVLVLMRVTGK